MASRIETARLSYVARMKRRMKTHGVRFLHRSGTAGLIGKFRGGRGVILMFHEFTHSPVANLDQGCRIEDFDALLTAIRRSGRVILRLDEGLDALRRPSGPPFVVLSFDDGYRSNIELALRVMERHEAPATIFVPTEMLTRTINAWWLGLRRLVEVNDRVDVAPMDMRLECPDLNSKIAALRRLTAWVWEDFRRADMLAGVFASHGVSLPDLVDELVMSESEMIAADTHPLIEIGAHTTTHRALGLLSEDEVARDVADNKRYLEDRLQREVPHFAYPYGPPSITGDREARIVERLGFRAAVTTGPGCLVPRFLNDSFLIPRQNAEYAEDGAAYGMCGVNGLFGGIPVHAAAGSADATADV
jgi:peptidoglycan/xylan/chitin deacetylase (PgdA/CDA1 family)